jgi:Icc-related predicted phosphoesterase
MKIRRISDQFVRNFKLRVMHVSDTHGQFPKLYGRFDAIVHTGDLFPNSHHVMNNDRTREMLFQHRWLQDEMSHFKSWLGGHPFLYVPGNHDFLASQLMELELRANSIEAFDLTDKMLTFQGVNFYGFPYVPAISGMWNYEREIPEMQKEMERVVEACNKQFIDVLAFHTPIYKCLDLSMGNQIIGSTVIADALDYKIDKDKQPSHYLCGHIHEAAGVSMRNGMLVSNAATTSQIIEV